MVSATLLQHPPTFIIPISLRAHHVEENINLWQPIEDQLPIVLINTVNIRHVDPHHLPEIIVVMTSHPDLVQRDVIG